MDREDARPRTRSRSGRLPALDWGGMAWLGLVIAVSGLAAYRIGIALEMYFAGSGNQSAGDLLRRWDEVHRWFAGRPVYGALPNAIYPPASYLLLWPFVGWLSAPSARLLFGGIEIAGLVWLAAELLRLGRVTSPRQRGLWTISLIAFQATAYSIAFGQLALLLLPLLVWAATARPRTMSGSAAVILAGLAALVKPTIAAPFVWLIVLAAGLPWAAALGAGYLALTAAAGRFQPAGLPALALQWIDAAQSRTATIGESNLQTWARQLGGPAVGVAASAVTLAAFCIWSYRRRRDDPLFLVAVAALVARVWAYHLSYDDLLLLVPLAWIHRAAVAGAAPGPPWWVRAVLACSWLVLLAPGAFALFPLSVMTVLEAARDLMILAIGAALFALRARAREAAVGVT